MNEEDYKCSNEYDDTSQDDVEMIRAVLAARESGGCNGQDSKLGEVPVLSR